MTQCKQKKQASKTFSTCPPCIQRPVSGFSFAGLNLFLYLFSSMLRQLLYKRTAGANSGFHFRGHEIRRIETFSDAVFAFAVTLLIVSLEVPRTFEELLTGMRGFLAFGICFCLLMIIWHEQNTFFRRYGLDDRTTTILNSVLIFIVLFYVYPLKFLFTLIFSDQIYGDGKSPFTIRESQVPQLMIIYDLGYIAIYGLFLLLYLHALRNKISLQLTSLELFDTRTKLYAHGLLISIGMLSIITALLLPPARAGWSGMVYALIGIIFTIYYSIRGKKRRNIYPPQPFNQTQK